MPTTPSPRSYPKAKISLARLVVLALLFTLLAPGAWAQDDIFGPPDLSPGRGPQGAPPTWDMSNDEVVFAEPVAAPDSDQPASTSTPDARTEAVPTDSEEAPKGRRGRRGRRRGRDKDLPPTPPNLATSAEKLGGVDKQGRPIEPDGPEIVSVEVLGNRLISRDVVLLSIELGPGDRISDSRIEKDLESLRDLGYFAYIEPEVVPVEDGKVTLLWKVLENPVLREVRVEGSTLIPVADLQASIVVEPGNVLNSTQLRESLSRINALYQERGYAFCGILSPKQFDMDRNTGVLSLQVAEPVLGQVTFTGNRKTRDHVILREFEIRKGRVLQGSKLRRSLKNLYRLNYFEEIQPPRPTLSEDLSVVDLEVELKEQRTGTASAGGGYSSLNGVIGFLDVAERNLGGRGQTMRVKWEFGGQRSYQLDFVEPWLGGKPRSLGISLFSTRVNRALFQQSQTTSLYEERRTGFALSTSRRVAKDTRINASFSDEKVTARSDGITALPLDLAVRDLDGNGEVEFDQQFLTLGWTKDARDSPFNANEGYRYAASVTNTGGFLKGPTGFLRYLFDARKYLPLGKRRKRKQTEDGSTGRKTDWTFATRLRYGFHSVFEGSLTFNDRFALGGSDSVRGYEDREFTGSRFALGNFELRRHLSQMVSVVAFYDMGDAWGMDGKEQDMNTAFGLGIRFVTPIGPFRLDWGKASDRSGRFHFGIGQQF